MASEMKVWLITGTSSGFGARFVASVLARGDKVIATARNIEKIRHFEAEGAATLRLDLTDDEESLAETVSTALAIHGHIDVLLNNAAAISTGTIEDLTPADYQAQFATNVWGPVALTRALLPHFRARRSGTTVFLSSLSGLVSHPGCSPYSMSKFALEAFGEALAAETRHLGLRTLIVEPGRFRTRFLSSKGNLRTKGSSIPEYQAFSEGLIAALEGEDGRQPGDPGKLAEVVVDLVKREGVAAGREVPLRVPVGGDCVAEVKARCEWMLEVVRDWQGVCTGTDVVG